jgi:predicted TIM-barrel fold metal-dependent hydrolase
LGTKSIETIVGIQEEENMPKKEDFFIVDCEAHTMPWEFRKHVSYYPGSQYFSKPEESPTGKWWNTNPITKERREKPADWTLEGLIAAMDEAGIDQACMLRESFLNLSYNGVPCSTNYHTIEAMQKHPDRIIGCSQVGPHMIRGVKNAIKELEILHKDYGFKCTKVYSPEDSGPLNHPDMFPFYEKCVELDIPVFFHTGFAVGGHMEYCHPVLLDTVCLAFPELKVVAYHWGWPHTEVLNCMAWKHRNISIGMSGLLGPWAYAPMKLAHVTGAVMNMLGDSTRLIFGTDWPAAPTDVSVQAVLDLEIPKELQEGWGYPPITAHDKANMFGLNLARLLDIEVPEAYRK